MSLKFTKIEDFDYYVEDYMLQRNTDELYVYMRYGHTVKEMLNSTFRSQVCSTDYPHGVLWFIDWYEGENFIEIASIMTREELEVILKEKEKNFNEDDY